MSTSLFLAQVLGPVFLVLAISLLTHCRTMKEAIGEMTKAGHKMFIFFASAVQLVAGMFLVLAHPMWSWNWDVIITVFGWLLILRSVLMLWFTESMLGMVGKMRNNSWWLYLGVIILAVCGLVLSYYGYWA